jgi:hypothetical protein
LAEDIMLHAGRIYFPGPSVYYTPLTNEVGLMKSASTVHTPEDIGDIVNSVALL